jgi:hypothetical protein
MKKSLLIYSLMASTLIVSPSGVCADNLQDLKTQVELAQKDLEDSKAYGRPVQAQAKKRLNQLEKKYKQLAKKAEKESAQNEEQDQ